MKKRTDLNESSDIERSLRSVFQSPNPDANFVDRLERELAERIASDVDERSRRGSFTTWLPNSAHMAALGFLALILVLALVWGINNLIPGATPGATTQVDPSPAYCPVSPIQTIWANSGPVAGEFPVWISSWCQSEYANLGPKVMPPESGELQFEQGRLAKVLVFVDQQIEGDLVITGRRLDGDEVIYFPDGQLQRLDESTLHLLETPPDSYVIPSAQFETISPNPPGKVSHVFGPLYITPGCYQITAKIAEYAVEVVVEITGDVRAEEEEQPNIPDHKTLLAILSLLDQEAKAQRDHNSEAYKTLLDPQANSEWEEIGLDRIETVVSPLPEAILVQRAVMREDVAMALVLIESGEPMYAIRYFRNTGSEGWKLTSPVAETWGERRKMQLENLKLYYYAFDEPYVSAVAARVARYLEAVAQDFGVSLENQLSLEVSLVPAEGPRSFWDEEIGDRMPLEHSFLLQQAETVENYLAWGLYDKLARLLIGRSVSETTMEERWSNLAEALVLWEVAQARGEPSREEIIGYVQISTAPDLSFLLDTGPYDPHDASERIQAQVALITFITETYGREILPGFLQAIFSQQSWQDIIQASLGVDPTDFQQRWEAWVGSQESSPAEIPENALLYIVQAGDTLENIAAEANVPLEIILALNNLEANSPLVAGQRLVIGIGARQSAPPTFSPPTPVTPMPAADPLVHGSSSDQIRRRLIEGANLWHTLWADAQIRTTSKNETHVNREQVWISQPGSIRWLSGQLGGDPRLARVTNGHQSEWIDLDSGEPLEFGDSGGFVIPSDLDKVIFPVKHFAYRGGTFRIFNTETVAGRQAVAVDWTNDEDHIVDRFWIDAYTGVILRWVHIPKEYPDASGRVIPSEIEITAIAYDIDFPAETFDPTALIPKEFDFGYGDK
jgi:hypothetical protein